MHPRLPARLRLDWIALTRHTEPAPPFDPAMADHLPEPVRRWLVHAIAPGTPLRRHAILDQHGAVRLGAWRRFEAVQALAPLEGFIWAATTHVYGVPVRGFDRFSAGTGELHHRAFGLATVASASGPDISRGAAARHTSELIWVPAVALAPEVEWKPVDRSQATAVIHCDGYVYEPTITVGPTGELSRVTIPRWTDVGTGTWHEELFAAVCHGEANFGGYTVPVHVSAGWGYGTGRWSDGGVFIREVVDRAVYH
jgi:hypothetical protein